MIELASSPRLHLSSQSDEPAERSVAAAAHRAIAPDMVHLGHYNVLDGWRGVSIILVLSSHLLPLWTAGNVSAGLLGMALFFNLSGFLITSFLLEPHATLRVFVIRRLFRIVPLMWLYLLVVFAFQEETPRSWVAHFLFYANLPPPQIRLATDHLWSVCVEMQFYIGISILFAMLRAKGLLMLPLLAIACTTLRVHSGVYASSVTWFRVDEILAGCTLALVMSDKLGHPGMWVRRSLLHIPHWLLIPCFIASCTLNNQAGLWLDYLRPYLGALLIGSTLVRPRARLSGWLDHRALVYLASISYALYVIHGGLRETWLGSGDVVERYAKRPLLFLVLFLLSHISTRYYEGFFVKGGKKFASSVRARVEMPNT